MKIELTEKEMAKAFTEWDRRYRENPEKFWSEAQHLLKSTPKTYGDACGPYFMKLCKEQKPKVLPHQRKAPPPPSDGGDIGIRSL